MQSNLNRHQLMTGSRYRPNSKAYFHRRQGATKCKIICPQDGATSKGFNTAKKFAPLYLPPQGELLLMT